MPKPTRIDDFAPGDGHSTAPTAGHTVATFLSNVTSEPAYCPFASRCSGTSFIVVLPGFRPNPGIAPHHLWHSHAMSRTRVSTTVDGDLLREARRVAAAGSDAKLLDQALGALLAQHRSAEADEAYRAYDEHPIDEPDEWGDLASFRTAVASS